jgi:hypothetical protein
MPFYKHDSILTRYLIAFTWTASPSGYIQSDPLTIWTTVNSECWMGLCKGNENRTLWKFKQKHHLKTVKCIPDSFAEGVFWNSKSSNTVNAFMQDSICKKYELFVPVIPFRSICSTAVSSADPKKPETKSNQISTMINRHLGGEGRGDETIPFQWHTHVPNKHSQMTKRSLFYNQPGTLIIQTLFCYKTLHISGNLFAHHQEFITVHLALVSLVRVFYDRFQVESRLCLSWFCDDHFTKAIKYN